MADLEVKKVLVEEALRKSNLSRAFDVVSNQNMVFFRSMQPYKNNKLLLGIILDDSAYTTITIFFGKVSDESKIGEVKDLIADLNIVHNIQKFVLNKNNELIVQIPYISLSKDFSGDLATDLLRTLYKLLINDSYDKFEAILGESMCNK